MADYEDEAMRYAANQQRCGMSSGAGAFSTYKVLLVSIRLQKMINSS